jgi:hypothetical protein
MGTTIHSDFKFRPGPSYLARLLTGHCSSTRGVGISAAAAVGFGRLLLAAVGCGSLRNGAGASRHWLAAALNGPWPAVRSGQARVLGRSAASGGGRLPLAAAPGCCPGLLPLLLPLAAASWPCMKHGLVSSASPNGDVCALGALSDGTSHRLACRTSRCCLCLCTSLVARRLAASARPLLRARLRRCASRRLPCRFACGLPLPLPLWTSHDAAHHLSATPRRTCAAAPTTQDHARCSRRTHHVGSGILAPPLGSLGTPLSPKRMSTRPPRARPCIRPAARKADLRVRLVLGLLGSLTAGFRLLRT